jgi:hypothetical protein
MRQPRSRDLIRSRSCSASQPWGLISSSRHNCEQEQHSSFKWLKSQLSSAWRTPASNSPSHPSRSRKPSAASTKKSCEQPRDISLFSQVLKLLAVMLERGHHANRISANAFETSVQIVEECKSLFDELDAVVAKSTSTKEAGADGGRMIWWRQMRRR